MYTVAVCAAALPEAGGQVASTGWHRKWLLLCAALVWLFFLRFRLMGWLLSHALTLALRVTQPRIRAVVHIQYVTLRPLEFGRIEVRGSNNDWCVVCTHVAVMTHVLEFFRSFVQKKMLLLAVEDVYVDLDTLDEEVVRDLVRQGAEADAMAKSKPTKKSNPMGFMRFIDFRVRHIRLKLDCFDTRVRFCCSDLKVDLPDVFVEHDYLHMRVEAAALTASCQRLDPEPRRPTERTHEVVSSERSMSASTDLLSCDVPVLKAVFSVQLTDQTVIACNIDGDKEETAYFHVSTAYLDSLLQTRMELIRRDLAPIPTALWRHDNVHPLSRNASQRAIGSPFSLRVVHCPVMVDIIHRSSAGVDVPLQLSAKINHLEQSKVVRRGSVSQPTNDEVLGSRDVVMSLDWEDIVLKHCDAVEVDVLRLTTARIEMRRNDSGKGSVETRIGDMDVATNPLLCDVLFSLADFPDVIDNYERLTVQLMMEKVAAKHARPLSPLPKKLPVTLSVDVQVETWSLRSWLGEMGGCHALQGDGRQTHVRSVMPPKSSGQSIEHDVTMGEVTVDVNLSSVASQDRVAQTHTINFAGVHVWTAKSTTGTTTLMDVKLDASSITVNNGANESDRLPKASFTDLSLRLSEIEASASLDTNILLTIGDLSGETHHKNHQRVMTECELALRIIEEVRAMVTPPEPRQSVSNEPISVDKVVSKSLKLSVVASNTRFRLIDIENVTSAVEFLLTETKINYCKSTSGTTNAATCAFMQLLWSDSTPAMEITSVKLDQCVPLIGKVSSQIQDPAQTTIEFSQLRVWLASQRRLLLLVLKLDELVNPKDEEDGAIKRTNSPSHQNVRMSCSKINLLFPNEQLPSDTELVLMDFSVHASMTNANDITEPFLRYLEVTRRSESCRPRLAEHVQVVNADGSVSAQAVEVWTSGRPVLSLQHFNVNFAMTDALLQKQKPWNPSLSDGALPPRILLFDVSACSKKCTIQLSSEAKSAAKCIVPILQDTVDTRETLKADEGIDEEEPFCGEWRIRYMGAVDGGIEELRIVMPCEADVFLGVYEQQYGETLTARTDRVLMLNLKQLAFNCRQFQKFSVQYEAFMITLVDHDLEDTAGGDASELRCVCGDSNLPLQLLYMPRTKVDAVVHWEEITAATTVEAFAISFDLVLRGKSVSSSVDVPVAGEALVALNWDYVYPLLIFLMTEDENDRERSEEVESVTAPTARGNASVFQCRGLQWNVSLDVIQVVWWDTLSQDAGILVVANDWLSHGIAVLHQVEPFPDERWVLWETTVYLDLCRSYILRQAALEDQNRGPLCGTLPFAPTQTPRFFIETTGTSYRETHDSNEGSLQRNPFGELAYAICDKIHDNFVRTDYSFCIGTVSRLHRMDSVATAGLQSIQAGTSVGSSPPKSPRAWTQSVRTKLARLKRRTSSTDNLLLNDGSKPIQVDSMKLLWTIETRDCAFYLIAVTSDSVEAILEAQRLREGRKQREASVQPLDGNTPVGGNEAMVRCGGRSNLVDDLKAEAARIGRRGSTRESLLELLHQGKLGNKDSTAMESNESSGTRSHTEKARFDNEEMHLPKTIQQKLYTLDVHDAQINMLEEASRSSALIASKHIHLEIGLDESGTTTIAALKFECVTGHVAPIDVDINAGVLWYSHSRAVSASSQLVSAPRTSSATPMLLKQVMEEFSLTTTYSQVLASGATAVEVDMSALQLSTDRHQFYQLLNVVRHVLLAPPHVVRRVRKATPASMASRGNASETSTMSLEMDIAVFPPAPASSSSTSSRKLHAQLVEELRIRDSKMLGTSRAAQVILKHISFRSAGCVFRLRTSPEVSSGDHEFVEIRAEGIAGSHMFFLSQSTKFVLNLQWMEINNLRPGPSSIAFEDAMAVLKAKLLVDQRYQSSKRVTLANQKGMLTVRAESGPQMRVLGQKLRVLDLLEVSIFPEIPNMIVIQLAADFYELVYKFFFEHMNASDHVDSQQTSEQVLFGKKASSSNMSTQPSSPLNSPSHASAITPLSPMAKGRGQAVATSPLYPVGMGLRRKSIQSSSSVPTMQSDVSIPGVLTVCPPGQTAGGEATADDDDSSSDGHELFYFKYVRIGNVRLRINCNGFFVNLNNFDLDLPPYVCQSKLCTWKKLLQKFESHLRWHVTKETASTGLSHFKNKLLKWTPTANADKKDRQKKEEDSVTLNAQVLFGPYSGAQ